MIPNNRGVAMMALTCRLTSPESRNFPMIGLTTSCTNLRVAVSIHSPNSMEYFLPRRGLIQLSQSVVELNFSTRLLDITGSLDFINWRMGDDGRRGQDGRRI